MIESQKTTPGGLPAEMVRCAAVVVPRVRRAEWRAEWESELWYVCRAGRGGPDPSRVEREALHFAVGAFQDALWLRRESLWRGICERRWMKSAVNCLLALTGLVALAGWLFVGVFAAGNVLSAGADIRGAMVGHFWSLALAVIALPANRPLRFAVSPPTGIVNCSRQLLWWTLLGAKFALIAATVFFGTLDLMNIIQLAAAPSQGFVDATQACLLGPGATLAYLGAFRWAFKDQMLRCPICLRRLSDPQCTDQSPQTILYSRGSDYRCSRGHGLIHIPDIALSYTAPRWLNLGSN